MAISRPPPLPYLRVSRVCSMRPEHALISPLTTRLQVPSMLLYVRSLHVTKSMQGMLSCVRSLHVTKSRARSLLSALYMSPSPGHALICPLTTCHQVPSMLSFIRSLHVTKSGHALFYIMLVTSYQVTSMTRK